MPISRFGVNTKLGNQKYDHKRQFVFTGGISTKQNKAIDNKIKSRTLNNGCNCVIPKETENNK